MMLEKNEKVNKNIQEAKVIVNNIDGVFKYFDSLKELLPQIKAGETETEEDPEMNDMIGSLGCVNQRTGDFFKVRWRGLHSQHQS